MACGRAAPEPPNLVLISIDTLRADRVSVARPEGAPPAAPTTPRLDAWARAHASVFRQAIAQAPWTLPSHASLLTGLDPLRHATNRSFHALPAELPTLAETLRARGYFTAALTGGGWLDPAYGLARGFERYESWGQAGQGDAEWERHAEQAVAWLDALPRPFLLFVHTYDVHDFPRATRLPPNTPDDERARLYDAAVAHMDAHLGPLLARLASEPLRSRTAVVITSDHGEALGEPAETGARDYGHGSLRDPVLRVPLLVSLPADAAYLPPRVRALARHVDTQVRLIDVAPTLLELAGARPDVGPLAGDAALDGASLVPLLRAQPLTAVRPAMSYFARPGFGLALRDGLRFKYRLDDAALAPPATGGAGAAPRETLFDLAADPAETRDLASTSAAAAALRARARRLLERHAAGFALTLRAGAGDEVIVLRGALLQHGAPTSPDASVLRRVADDAGEIAVPTRQARALLLQPAGDLRLELQVAGVTTTLEAQDAGTRGVTLAFDGRAWRLSGANAARCRARVCVEAAWRGVGAPAARATAVADPGLRERLRALGYVQ
jgi:arylsulfatase A-like enzyme